jgi:hypothetical protein
MKNNQKLAEQIFQNGKLIKKLNSSGSAFNSEACVYIWLDNHYVVRKIGKQYNLTDNQLVNLGKNIHTYYKLLQKHLAIGLPKIFLTTTLKEQDVLLLVTEYFQNRKVINYKNNSRKFEYFRIIAMALINLINSKSNIYSSKLICSIDPNPDNFFVDLKGQIIYNDFTPPLYRKNGKWLEFRRRDELHVKRTDKEKRYFTGLNLLLVFVNKTRIHLTFSSYLKFVRWLSDEIQKQGASTQSNLIKFPILYKEIEVKKEVDFKKFEKYAVLRDLLRFALTFDKNLTNRQIKDVYKKSKRVDGLKILTKKLYE